MMSSIIALLSIASLAHTSSSKVLQNSLVCDVSGHPVYDKTAVFGTGTPQIFFIRKDRKESFVHHKDLQVFTGADGVTAVSKENQKILFFTDLKNKGFVEVIGTDKDFGLKMKSGRYKVKTCLFIE